VFGPHAYLVAQTAFGGDDEALDPLDDDARNRVLRLLNDELKDAAIINIGRPETESHFFTRVLHLVKDPQGRCFLPDLRVAYSSAA
jgi:ABC-type uncharacterized transport system fused permease/ATPase subunit